MNIKHWLPALLLVVVGIGTAQAKINIVATTPDLAALAREIGGNRVEITTLAKPTEDPHFVEPKPSFIVKLSRADALLEGGAELEIGWLTPLLEGARNRKIAPGQPGRIVCSQGVEMLEVPAVLDRAQGDIHAAGNPHYLTDPANAKIVATNIAAAFARMEVGSADFFQANLKRFTTQLDAKLAEWQKALAPHQGRRIVCYHNSWPYFAKRFGLRMDLFLEPKPGIPPTPAHLAAVIATMKSEKIGVVFVEPQLSRRTAENVARNTGALVVEVSHFPGGVKGTEIGYFALMDHIVSSLAKALAAQK
ncbi:MAG: zinc ABC transporter substrate-binding protein [Pedosphaera sp.]|nr:zinc ABC transporter substrate-binding protein [Pedosphaera sp.]